MTDGIFSSNDLQCIFVWFKRYANLWTAIVDNQRAIKPVLQLPIALQCLAETRERFFVVPKERSEQGSDVFLTRRK